MASVHNVLRHLRHGLLGPWALLLALAAVALPSQAADTGIDVPDSRDLAPELERCQFETPKVLVEESAVRVGTQTASSFDRSPETVYRIVNRFHVVRRADGSGGIDETVIDALMRDLNYGFRNTPFVFLREPGVTHIDNDAYYADFPTFQSAFDMIRDHYQSGIMSWYITPNINGAVAGTWIRPASPHRGILMAYHTTGAPSNIVTPTHEMAHIFQVYHPFETALGTECSSGSNCASAGDLVCDTPASPGVHGGNTTATGIYFGNARGPCVNDPVFAPNPRLYMDAGWDAGHILRNEFSQGEMERAVSFLSPTSRYPVADLVGPERPEILVDCDGNGEDDIDEILSGRKTDLGRDLVPDVCQLFPRDGDLIVTGMNPGPNNRLRYYDRSSGQWRGDLWNGMSYVHQARAGPDGLVYLARLNIVQRVSLMTGRTVDNFIDGVLDNAGTFVDLLFEPSGDILVLDNVSQNLRRYDGNSGQFKGVFITIQRNGFAPKYMEFGPDGQIYVVGNGASGNTVLRFDAASGQYLGLFVSEGSGGLAAGQGLVFHEGYLYVSNGIADNILRFDAQTGAFDRVFVSGASGGLSDPHSLRFGPDGHLYVASRGANSVKRYHGSSGAYLGDFVAPGAGGPPGTGGLSQPAGLLFATVTGVAGPIINAGLNDAWYNPQSDGQGFFINVFPAAEKLFLGWFTYETDQRPQPAPSAELGEPYHRWLTAIGPWQGSHAALDVTNTSGGYFDDPAAVTRSGAGSYGTIDLEFHDCRSATLAYDLPGIGQGSIPIVRLVDDNTALCEALQ